MRLAAMALLLSALPAAAQTVISQGTPGAMTGLAPVPAATRTTARPAPQGTAAPEVKGLRVIPALAASGDAVQSVAQELQGVNGRFDRLSPETLKLLKVVSLSEAPQAAVDLAVETAEKGFDSKDETLQYVVDKAVAISDADGKLLGYIVLPFSYLPIPEGDTDYRVLTYVFIAADGRLKASFRVYDPVF